MKSIKETVIYTQSWTPLLRLPKEEAEYYRLLQEFPLLFSKLTARANRATRKLDKKLDNANNEEY